jgi:hypothetical protein
MDKERFSALVQGEAVVETQHSPKSVTSLPKEAEPHIDLSNLVVST